MTDDATVCYCFHVTKRKLLSFMRTERPRVASQLSLCNGAGTGCGWCVPLLKMLFEGQDDTRTAEERERQRAEHIRTGKGTPPGAAP